MSKCVNIAPLLVCYTDGVTGAKTTLIEHVLYENGVAIGQGYTTVGDTETIFDVSAGTVTGGACPIASPDVEWAQLCDVQADGSIVEFFRRTVTSFDANGAVVVPVSVADFALDKVTAYTVTGTVTTCNQDCDLIGSVGTIASRAAVI